MKTRPQKSSIVRDAMKTNAIKRRTKGDHCLMICKVGCPTCDMSKSHRRSDGNGYGCYDINKMRVKKELN